MGNVDYLKHNICLGCKITYSKDIIRCPKCHQLVRTTPYNKNRYRKKLIKVGLK